MTVPTSGVADCPCCGETIMVSDVSKPDKCDDCKDGNCQRPNGEFVGGWHDE